MLLNPERVSVKVEAGSAVVYDYRLAQNYPNPFNPSTRIEYGLKTRGLVTIQVYDVLGRVLSQRLSMKSKMQEIVRSRSMHRYFQAAYIFTDIRRAEEPLRGR